MSDTPERESERRFATVMFADISGFTAMSEQMDPEDVTDVMNGCFALMESIVQAHGGVVDKYIGDCVMALFGVPHAIEDAPALALKAAIEIRNRLDEFNRTRKLAVPLETHVGINTGLVVAGHVGGERKRDFTVMGDTVNLAARLRDAAPSGAIWVGGDTYSATRDQFEFRKLELLTFKGKEKPVSAWEAVSVVEEIHPTVAANRMVFSPLVGRERELAVLESCIDGVIHGKGGIVTLIAEAGIGKSRLLSELRKLRTGQDVLFLEGRAQSMGSNLSYHPFIDLLRHWAGIRERDSDSEAVEKLEQAARDLLGEEIGEILPFVATLMGMRLAGSYADRVVGIQGEALEKLIAKSMRELLRRMAARTPLVVIFEDLHWADQSSIVLLESLLRLTTETPILVINLMRPDSPETSDRILATLRAHYAERHTEVRLQPLDNRQCDELVANLLRLDDLPFSTRALIARRTDGNPFFIEEVVRSLIDQGAIEERNGHLRITERIEHVVIPGTIQEVIMTRIDRLPESTRHVLHVAAVIGRTFFHRIITEILGGELELQREIEHLKDRQLIRERQTHRTATARRLLFHPEVEYAFTHALVQETLYASILQRTRKDLHLKVAQSIETVFQDRLPDFYGMLAYHYSRAEQLEKAEEYLFKAGDEAARSAASNEALNLFREASRLYLQIHGKGGDPARKALLEKNIGLTLMARGRLPESIEHFNRALEHLGEKVPRAWFSVHGRFSIDLLAVLRHLFVKRSRRRARPHDHDILEIRYNRARAQVMSDPQRMFFDTIGTIRRMNQIDTTGIDDACGMYAGAALLFSFSGVSFGISRRILDVAKGMIRQENSKDLFVCREMEFLHHQLEGDWSEDFVIDDQLVETNLRYGQLWDVNTYLGLLCERHIHQGDLEKAIQVRTRLREIADVYYLDFARSNEYAMTAWILLQQRRLGEALAAVDLYYQSRDEEMLNLLALGTKAKIQLLLGDRPAACQTLMKAQDLMRRSVPIPPYYQTFARTAQLLSDISALEESFAGEDHASVPILLKRAERAQRVLIRLVSKVAWERVEAFRLAGRLAWITGKRARALRWFAKSIGEGERLGARPELARTYMEVGARLTAKEAGPKTLDGLDGVALLEKARTLFAALGFSTEIEEIATLQTRAA